jgi:hypothetical protein
VILDFHANYSPAFFRYRQYHLDLDVILARMDDHGVGRAVLCAGGEFVAIRNAEGNRAVADAVRGHPERFTGFAAINPLWLDQAVEELKRACDEYGFAGIALHPILQGFEANDPLVFPLVEAADDRLRPRRYAVPRDTVQDRRPCRALSVESLRNGPRGMDFHFDVPYCLEASANLWAETSRNGLANLESSVRRFGAGAADLRFRLSF